MDYNDLEDFGEDNNINEDITEIDPRDTYSSRYEVTSRSTSSRKPRAAISSGTSRIRNSKRIFTSKHERSAFGGDVNMKNVSAKQHFDKTADSNAEQINKQEDIETNNKPAGSTRSSGLDSLFSSTTDNTDNQEIASKQNLLKKKLPVIDTKPKTVEDQDPDSTGRIKIKIDENENEANYSSTSNEKPDVNKVVNVGTQRGLKILKPSSFNNIEPIANAFKNRDAVVLCLKFANKENVRRILDFSFGAASVCGAQVNVEPGKTYVFTIGPGLTQKEKLKCIEEGIVFKDK